MTLDKFINLLETQTLFFTPLESYAKTDPFEGFQPKACLEQFIKTRNDSTQLPRVVASQLSADSEFGSIIQEADRKFKEMYLDMIKGTKVNCWHMNNHESEAMWKLYSENNKGICISTKISSLLNSIDITNLTKDIHIGKVKYLDFFSEKLTPEDYVINNDPLSPLLKRKSYEHENEIRLYIAHDVGEPIKPESINVNIATLIENIYISPYSDSLFESSVKAICTKFLPTKTFIGKSNLLDGHLELLNLFNPRTT
ncbi:DUF2971 domain-containing protein [uncultured Tolumonas sp.]|uniref:DUF2971 domain-containing protein n=1 Tax=uncultured Tolumonas sp. TaxID=263765 RepID=UPI00292D221C|nr:DUF2971 domain-containing protein [uncultured Tolumonas sp.]